MVTGQGQTSVCVEAYLELLSPKSVPCSTALQLLQLFWIKPSTHSNAEEYRVSLYFFISMLRWNRNHWFSGGDAETMNLKVITVIWKAEYEKLGKYMLQYKQFQEYQKLGLLLNKSNMHRLFHHLIA